MPSVLRPVRPPILGPTRGVGSLAPPYADQGGGTAWAPGKLGSSLTLWLDERGQVGSPISPWNDNSPAGNNFTATVKPTTGATINGYAAPTFTNASSQFMQSNALSSFITATQCHVFAVVKAASVPKAATASTFYIGNGVFGDLTGGYMGLVTYDVAGTKYAAFGGYDTAGHAAQDVITVGTATLLEGWLTSDQTLHLRVGSAAAVTAAMTGAIGNITGTASLSKASAVLTPSGFFDGQIASVLVCNRSLTAGEQAAARQYLGTKYGVAY